MISALEKYPSKTKHLFSEIIERILYYRVDSYWTVRGTKEEVSLIFEDTANLQTWWPAAFLRTTLVCDGDSNSIGKVVRVHAKGRWPHSMRFWFRVNKELHPDKFLLVLTGDFCGEAICRLKEVGNRTELELSWRVRVRKPVLILGSFFVKKLLIKNHLWAMAQGEKSLNIELEKRRGLENTPPPPGPSFPHNRSSGSLFRRLLFDDPLSDQIPVAFR